MQSDIDMIYVLYIFIISLLWEGSLQSTKFILSIGNIKRRARCRLQEWGRNYFSF